MSVASAAEDQIVDATDLTAYSIASHGAGNAIDHSLKQSTAQRQNILRAAFSGQLVPQDPNDEPASVLLERIRAERAEREKQPKTRKAARGARPRSPHEPQACLRAGQEESRQEGRAGSRDRVDRG